MKNTNIEVTRGDTDSITFRLSENGAAVDISAWSAFVLTVDPSPAPVDGTTKVDEITGVIIDGPGGRVSFSPSGTSAPGSYYFDAQGTNAGGKKRTFARGSFKIIQDITKI